jgi:hypothetical protein
VRAFRDCEGDNIVVKVRKRYNVSTRPPATLLLSPRVLNCPSSLPALNVQLTSSGILVAVFGVCGNGDYGVCYVSQHEEISTRAPRFCVAYQAPNAVARDGTMTEPYGRWRGNPCGCRRRNPCGCRRSAPCGRRRRNPRGRQRRIPCGRRRPARARVRHGRLPSSSMPRGPGPPRTAPRVPHAGGEKLQSFNASSRDSPALSKEY